MEKTIPKKIYNTEWKQDSINSRCNNWARNHRTGAKRYLPEVIKGNRLLNDHHVTSIGVGRGLEPQLTCSPPFVRRPTFRLLPKTNLGLHQINLFFC